MKDAIKILGFIFWVAVNTLFCDGVTAQTQEAQLAGATADSLDNWSDESFYRFNLIRLRRQVTDHREMLTDTTLNNEIANLLKEANQFARDGDYFLANQWVETILDLVGAHTNADRRVEDSTADLAETTNEELETESKFQINSEVMTGVDYWRLRYNLALPDTLGPSVFGEDESSPYTGVRFGFDYPTSPRGALQGHTYLKYSPNYMTGEARLRYYDYVTSTTRLRLEDRLEGTSFKREVASDSQQSDRVRYWQNFAEVSVEQTLVGPLSVQVSDELHLQRYADSDSTYPNYFDNALDLEARLSFGLGSLFSAGYRTTVRRYPDFELNDYAEQLLHLLWLQSAGWGSWSLHHEYRVRDYQNVPRDYFFQDFSENFFTGDIELKFRRQAGVEVQGTFASRDYKLNTTTSLPDELQWELEPRFYFRLAQDWKIGLGGHYGELTNRPFRLTTNATTDVLAARNSIDFEDYREYGPLLTIDLFKISGLFVSVREAFLFRRYPNSPANNIDGFNQYTDRNRNSLVLFLTWPITTRWELSVLANFDDDRSLKSNSGDTQNTLLDVEITYSF